MQITDILAETGGLAVEARPEASQEDAPGFGGVGRGAHGQATWGRCRAGTRLDARPERRRQSTGRHPEAGRKGIAVATPAKADW